MSYLSIEFTIIFMLFFALYWCFKQHIKIQNWLLLIASYSIVGFFQLSFALILAGYTIIIYLLSQIIYYRQDKKRWLTIAIIVTVGNLVIFKYFDFFRESLQQLLYSLNCSISLPNIEIILPIGISFYTFHSISYLVSIYRQDIRPVSFDNFALFLSFFPSIIAGPINRAREFLPQVCTQKERYIFAPYRAMTLILLAIIKVYWLSSALSIHCIDPVFATPMEYHSFDLLLALYLYAIQIYLNFSGYTDLVTAIALLLGFHLPINFNLPYLATNLRDFWQRWHISLSTWIRDYIYIPLGGNRNSFSRTQFNIFIAMLLSGLWHGAGLNFILWGIIHGVGIVILNIINSYLGCNVIAKHSTLLAKLLTLHYVCFAWIFFRSNSVKEAFEYLSALIHNHDNISMKFNSIILIILLFIAYCFYPHWAQIPRYFEKLLCKIPWFCISLLFIIIIWLVIHLAPPGIPQFIYATF
ncbi:MAG: MBOAT family protein [Candidatus Schmidhempelia sp.]|nr:MBOAT family protein [Candidatus Schmidhempelia sp.]